MGKHCGCNCTESHGDTYRGYGPNFTPGGNVFFLGDMFDHHGCQVGRVSAEDTPSGHVNNVFALNNGSRLEVLLTQQASLLAVFPIDAQIIVCFPETAPYLNNPDYGLLTTSCNHKKGGDPGVVSWNGTGKFKNVNVLQVRCVFLLYQGAIKEQLGCQWFIGKQ